MNVKGIDFAFSVGGDDKKNSSSWILKEYSYSSVDRIWGKFYNLFSDDVVKVKELIILPGKGLSFQRHYHRSEVFFVSKGQCQIKYSEGGPDNAKVYKISKDEVFHVESIWHQLINLKISHLIEIIMKKHQRRY